MATCDPQELLDAAGCFACLVPQQLDVLRTKLLCDLLQQLNPMATCDPQSLMDSAACLACLTPNDHQIIQTQLLCELVEAGGVGGRTCVVCGNTDPVDDPACACALGYNRATGSLWFWDDTAAAWKQLIGG